jgi:hypothetical protein
MADSRTASGTTPTADLQSRPYRQDRLVVVVPATHPLAERESVSFSDVIQWDIVGMHAGSSISLATRAAAAQAGLPLRQRIQVTSLDAMCRMIDNGLGLGLLPDRAFALMHGVGQLRAITLDEPWAQRELCVVARDFEALPVTARLLAEHLRTAGLASESPGKGLDQASMRPDARANTHNTDRHNSRDKGHAPTAPATMSASQHSPGHKPLNDSTLSGHRSAHRKAAA